MYDPGLTMSEARRSYFVANGFAEDGGYADKWVDFKLGPIPFPFPNSPARVKAVRYHDLHHVITGYHTDFVGELEISGWEIGAGCKSMVAAWVLNLGGMGAGLFVAPRRVFRAYVRGRHSDTLYAEDFDPLLEAKVGDLSDRHVARESNPTAFDYVRFVAMGTAGLALGVTLFSVLVPLLPLGFVSNWFKKRAS